MIDLQAILIRGSETIIGHYQYLLDTRPRNWSASAFANASTKSSNCWTSFASLSCALARRDGRIVRQYE